MNYYGNRLDDYDLDGKFDIMMRAKEYLDGSWDLPSWNPRVYLKGSITPNFKFTLEMAMSEPFTDFVKNSIWKHESQKLKVFEYQKIFLP